jgi:hypothetical protein
MDWFDDTPAQLLKQLRICGRDIRPSLVFVKESACTGTCYNFEIRLLHSTSVIIVKWCWIVPIHSHDFPTNQKIILEGSMEMSILNARPRNWSFPYIFIVITYSVVVYPHDSEFLITVNVLSNYGTTPKIREEIVSISNHHKMDCDEYYSFIFGMDFQTFVKTVYIIRGECDHREMVLQTQIQQNQAEYPLDSYLNWSY